MALYEVQEVHHLILFDAADIANKKFQELSFVGTDGKVRNLEDGLDEFLDERDLVVLNNEIFRADPDQSEKGGLCLSIDPVVYQAIPVKFRGEIQRIGREAIHEALMKNQEQFVGLILGEARQGRTYFDRFEPPDQGRLF